MINCARKSCSRVILWAIRTAIQKYEMVTRHLHGAKIDNPTCVPRQAPIRVRIICIRNHCRQCVCGIARLMLGTYRGFRRRRNFLKNTRIVAVFWIFSLLRSVTKVEINVYPKRFSLFTSANAFFSTILAHTHKSPPFPRDTSHVDHTHDFN